MLLSQLTCKVVLEQDFDDWLMGRRQLKQRKAKASAPTAKPAAGTPPTPIAVAPTD
jgi:hypothetical protein